MSALHPPTGDEPRVGHHEPTLYNLVYCSRAAPGIADDDVQRIIATARRWNPERGITGMLVFGSGVFFQWLEGPRDNITALMLQLRADSRHNSIVVLNEVEEVRERLFPDWDMELVTGAQIHDVLQDALDSSTDPHNVQALSGLLADLDDGPLRALGAA